MASLKILVCSWPSWLTVSVWCGLKDTNFSLNSWLVWCSTELRTSWNLYSKDLYQSLMKGNVLYHRQHLYFLHLSSMNDTPLPSTWWNTDSKNDSKTYLDYCYMQYKVVAEAAKHFWNSSMQLYDYNNIKEKFIECFKMWYNESIPFSICTFHYRCILSAALKLLLSVELHQNNNLQFCWKFTDFSKMLWVYNIHSYRLL